MTFPIATVDDLLRVWREGMAPAYRHGIEFGDGGRGFDPIVGQASMFARVAQAVAVTSQAYYLRPHSTQVAPEAHAAEYAVGLLSFGRTPPANGGVTLAAGSQVVIELHDVTGDVIEASTYELLTPVVFAVGDVGPYLGMVKALRVGYQANESILRGVAFVELGRYAIPSTVGAGNVITDTVGIGDRITPDLLGRYVRFAGGPNATTFPRLVTAINIALDQSTTTNTITVDGPPLLVGVQVTEVEEFADIGLTCALASDLLQGRHGWLDAIGEERLCFRQSGEADPEYLARILALVDVVSPAALVRAATRVLAPLGIPFQFHEASEPLTITGFLWYPTLYQTGNIGQVPITVNLAPLVRYFVIVVPLSSMEPEGSYYDVFQGATDENYLDGGAYADSFPFAWNANMQALFNELLQTKEGGVAFQIIIDPLS